MKSISTKWLLVFTLISTNLCLADHNDLVHFAAHAGTAYAGTTLCYGGLKPLASRIVTLPTCSALVMLAGLVYDNTEPLKARSTARNAVGVVAAIGSVVAFDF